MLLTNCSKGFWRISGSFFNTEETFVHNERVKEKRVVKDKK